MEGTLELKNGGGYEFDGVIADAMFGVNPNYNDAAVVLRLSIESPELDSPREENLSIGGGFEVVGRGEGVTKKDMRFSKSSRVGWWIEQMHQLPGCVEDIVAKKGANPQSAEWWVGLRFRFGLREYVNPVTKETRMALAPIEWHGFGDEAVEVPAAIRAIAAATNTPAEFQVAAAPFMGQLSAGLSMKIADDEKCSQLWEQLRAQ